MADRKKMIRKEAGQAMVEFALVLPLLVLVIMGCMEFAWYFTSKYSLNQYAYAVGHNVKAPQNLIWYHMTAPRMWKDASGGQKPSWLTVEEKNLWSFDEYDGWFPLSSPAPGSEIGPDYFYYAMDSKMFFDHRLQDVVTLIDPDEIDYQITGGWYIKAEALHLPESGGSAWDKERDAEKVEYYYADIKVEMTYQYAPLTPVGEWLLCRGGSGSVTMKTTGRYVYNFPPSIST